MGQMTGYLFISIIYFFFNFFRLNQVNSCDPKPDYPELSDLIAMRLSRTPASLILMYRSNRLVEKKARGLLLLCFNRTITHDLCVLKKLTWQTVWIWHHMKGWTSFFYLVSAFKLLITHPVFEGSHQSGVYHASIFSFWVNVFINRFIIL
jgi:hypothetical protein